MREEKKEKVVTDGRESLESSVGLLALESLESIGGLRPLLVETNRLVGLRSSDGHQTTNTLGDSIGLEDSEGLDVGGLVDVAVSESPKTKRERSAPPSRPPRCLSLPSPSLVSVDDERNATHVPPQNSTLVPLHFSFSTSLAISSTSNSKVTTLTGSG